MPHRRLSAALLIFLHYLASDNIFCQNDVSIRKTNDISTEGWKMARYPEATDIYVLAAEWRQTCLVECKSLLWKGESIWSQQNLKDFKTYFTDRPDTTPRSFEEKFKEQLALAKPDVTKLACELVLIYFLFPMPSSVSGYRKKELISAIAAWRDIKLDEASNAVFKRMEVGIGGVGQSFHTRRPFELSYLGEVALEIAAMPLDQRAKLVNDDLLLRALLIKTENESTKTSKDILLHLLFPDKYERIASRNHKHQIVQAFAELLDGDVPQDPDDALFAIRKRLVGLNVATDLDFYYSPLKQCWRISGEDNDLTPLQGLAVKKQVVLYGPPGTGKTYEARQLADRIIRQALLRSWKPKRYFESSNEVEACIASRTRRVQFHPGYSYEDFVRGLRLAEGGKTEYCDGVLLRIVEEINHANDDFKEIPFVLILDELNRADLSKVLGECFSLFEDRDEPVQLGGTDEKPRKVSLPPTLLIVGTMNLIDQSLEQIDFALRRRFLWFFRGFERAEFREVCEYRWRKLQEAKRIKCDWSQYSAEFEVMADRAVLINDAIAKYPTLGKQYEIGHTYFCDVVSFVEKDLIESPRRRTVLFKQKGGWSSSTVGALWKYSLEPLLQQYLSGIDNEERQAFIGKLQALFLQGSAA